jgi:pyruvate,orthophosphate dikinase
MAQVPFVHDFSTGSMDMKDLLGGKGANLAEMTRLGIPVPPGFTITTQACRAFLELGSVPAELFEEVDEHLARLEATMGRRLGNAADPLLVSVRSGAKFSMPGMMETVLNIGLNDTSVEGLAAQTENPRFAWDSYRRLVQMYGKTVLDLDGDRFEDAIDAAKAAKGVTADVDLDADDLRALVSTYKSIIEQEACSPFPQDPRAQLHGAIVAVFNSWNSPRAILYRRREHIPTDLGTAVNVQAMAFGNRGSDSGSGVAFTRDPSTGAVGVYGDYLPDAQGEDVVAGIRNTLHLADLEGLDKASYDQLLDIMARLESHYRDMCDIEFTIERGQLWMLQTRVGKRTAEAAFRIAVDLVDEGVITEEEALLRVTGDQLAQLMFPHFDPQGARSLLAKGMSASPGAAVGVAVFDSEAAVRLADAGTPVILVRRETNPDDLHGMVAAAGILTSRGGKTSHAAVVARGMGRTCVCGAETLEVDTRTRQFTTPDGTVVREGDTISIDGSTGEIFAGEVAVRPSPVVRYFEGTMSVEEGGPLVAAVDRLMTVADRHRRMQVRANADNAEDAARARRFGAQGIGLCRTEHMFLGERRELVERLILAEGPAERQAVFGELLPLQRADFIEIFEAMDGLPVTVRLLDPPLHEFLPDFTELSVKVAVAEATGREHDTDSLLLLALICSSLKPKICKSDKTA